jgi:hypothetical protein
MSKALKKLKGYKPKPPISKKLLSSIVAEGFDREDLQDKLIFVKVGTDEHPSSREELEAVSSKMNLHLKSAGISGAYIIVTSHTVSLESVDKDKLEEILEGMEEAELEEAED